MIKSLLQVIIQLLKGPAHSKNENGYFSVLAQTKRMQPILVSCEAPFRSNLQNRLVQCFFCKLLLKGASHDSKIGDISLVWAGAKKYKF